MKLEQLVHADRLLEHVRNFWLAGGLVCAMRSDNRSAEEKETSIAHRCKNS
jgi:hypothetical protein